MASQGANSQNEKKDRSQKRNCIYFYLPICMYYLVFYSYEDHAAPLIKLERNINIYDSI